MCLWKKSWLQYFHGFFVTTEWSMLLQTTELSYMHVVARGGLCWSCYVLFICSCFCNCRAGYSQDPGSEACDVNVWSSLKSSLAPHGVHAVAVMEHEPEVQGCDQQGETSVAAKHPKSDCAAGQEDPSSQIPGEIQSGPRWLWLPHGARAGG